MYQEKYFYLCRVPLSAGGPSDVEVISKADTSFEFPELFDEYEERRSHAFNKDQLFSIIRADEINLIIRNTTPDTAKAEAFAEATPELITVLQHKVMQNKDKEAMAILKKVHDVDIKL